jgi:hypothetical protein
MLHLVRQQLINFPDSRTEQNILEANSLASSTMLENLFSAFWSREQA